MFHTLYYLIKILRLNKVTSLRNQFEFIDKMNEILFGKKSINKRKSKKFKGFYPCSGTNYRKLDLKKLDMNNFKAYVILAIIPVHLIFSLNAIYEDYNNTDELMHVLNGTFSTISVFISLIRFFPNENLCFF